MKKINNVAVLNNNSNKEKELIHAIAIAMAHSKQVVQYNKLQKATKE